METRRGNEMKDYICRREFKDINIFQLGYSLGHKLVWDQVTKEVYDKYSNLYEVEDFIEQSHHRF